MCLLLRGLFVPQFLLGPALRFSRTCFVGKWTARQSAATCSSTACIALELYLAGISTRPGAHTRCSRGDPCRQALAISLLDIHHRHRFFRSARPAGTGHLIFTTSFHGAFGTATFLSCAHPRPNQPGEYPAHRHRTPCAYLSRRWSHRVLIGHGSRGLTSTEVRFHTRRRLRPQASTRQAPRLELCFFCPALAATFCLRFPGHAPDSNELLSSRLTAGASQKHPYRVFTCVCKHTHSLAGSCAE